MKLIFILKNNNENKSCSNNRFYQVQNNLEKFIYIKKLNKGFQINNIDNLNNNTKMNNKVITLKLYQYFLPYKTVILLEKYCDKIYQFYKY